VSASAARSQRALTIALMLESDGPGGAERMLLQLAGELRDRGHTVVPVGPARGCGWLAGEFRALGFQPETFLLRRPLDWGCVRGLVGMLRKRRVDVVHSHEFTMAVYGAAAAGRVGVPHVITMHGGRGYQARWRRRLALRWAAGRSRVTVAVSRSTAWEMEAALGMRPGSVVIIPNGIRFQPGDPAPVRTELRLEAGQQLILAVGNLYEVKGHMVLLQALAELHSAGLPERWHLAIAGRGSEEGALRAFIRSAGLDGRVTLLGYREDIPNLLAAADLWVMPSLSEGLPLALVEAMFARKPIVASGVGGIPEVVTSGEQALLVPPSDPGALARASRRLLSDRPFALTLGAAAEQLARERFGVDRMADAYETLYRREAIRA
jgi:glycosyltransferase involved in cell wall biosynthesis